MGRPTKDRELGGEVGSRVLEMWNDGISAKDIGDELGYSKSAICRYLNRIGVSTNHVKDRHHNWKGGRQVTSTGYVIIAIDIDDPYFSMAQKNGYVAEHRYNMAKYLGRLLYEWETVHHIDGNRQNNNIQNLQLRIGPHGAGQAYHCADCGSINIVPTELD